MIGNDNIEAVDAGQPLSHGECMNNKPEIFVLDEKTRTSTEMVYVPEEVIIEPPMYFIIVLDDGGVISFEDGKPIDEEDDNEFVRQFFFSKMMEEEKEAEIKYVESLYDMC